MALRVQELLLGDWIYEMKFDGGREYLATPNQPFLCSTKRYASFASSTQADSFASMTTHSFINLPWPGSNRLPCPERSSSSTRSPGSFTTNSPFDDIIAKILPLNFRAPEPKPFPSPELTPGMSTKALTTRAKRGSISSPRSAFRRVIVTDFFIPKDSIVLDPYVR